MRFLVQFPSPLVTSALERLPWRGRFCGHRCLRFEPLEQRTLLATFELSTLGAGGVTIYGGAFADYSGRTVSSAGDFNGDGFDDMIVSGRSSGLRGTFLILGGTSLPQTVDLASPGSADMVITGTYAGHYSSGAGDVNGDGFDDLILGAPGADVAGPRVDAGKTYIVYGTSSPPASLSLDSLGSAGVTLLGAEANDWTGTSVSSAGDVNGDGYADVIIGAPAARWDGVITNNKPGKSHLVFGGPSLPSTIDLASLGAAGTTIHGIDNYDRSGISVSRAGDVNDDGYADLIIGASYADGPGNGRNEAGESYVFLGGPRLPETLDLSALSEEGITLFGPTVGDHAGWSVSSAGDVNRDGNLDFLVGAPDANIDPGTPGSGEGISYLVCGSGELPETLDLASLGEAGIVNRGSGFLEGSGSSVSGGGDINGDGADDYIIGAFKAAGYKGVSYVVFSDMSLPSTLDLGTLATGQSQSGRGLMVVGVDDTDRSGYWVSHAGDVNGDGFDDFLIGAPWADGPPGETRANAGESYLVFGGDFSSVVTHLGDENDNTLTGTSGDDIIIGGAGNDTLIGNGGDDVLRGGQGDDVFVISGRSSVRGGSGFDTLQLNMSNDEFPLHDIPDYYFHDIEAIDISGTGPNWIRLNPQEVLNLSDETNTLVLIGDGDDLAIIDTGWLRAGSEQIGGTWFDVFTYDAAMLKIAQGMDVAALDEYFLEDLYWDHTRYGRTRGWYLDGIDQSDQSGFSVSSAGDFNGDGWDDLLVGAPLADPGGVAAAGETYLVFGPPDLWTQEGNWLPLGSLDGSIGFRLDGVHAGGESGTSVRWAGDINGDGLDDLIIGAGLADLVGEAYVVFGSTGPFAAAFDLSSLDGSNGFAVRGATVEDNFGVAVSSAGDVNGDGYEDLILGAPGHDPSGRDYAGTAYVVFGKATGFSASLDISSLDGSNGFAINGVSAGDATGISVGTAADFNGDGFDDLLIGADGANPGGNEEGASYLVFGKSGGFAAELELSSLDGSAGFVIPGVDAYGYGGWALGSAGDINGDGFDDVMFTASGANAGRGKAYAVFGSAGPFGGSFDLTTLNGSNGLVIGGAEDGDGTGFAVSGGGDVNGDGFDDLLIGSPGTDSGDGSDAGAAAVVFGQAGAFPASLNVSDLDGTNGLALYGVEPADEAGKSLALGGDCNGDGLDDLLIGAPYGQPDYDDSGVSYLFFGEDFLYTITHRGGESADNLVGDAAADVMLGGGGDDVLVGGGGADVLRGGPGDDILAVSDLAFARTQGGNGEDALRLDAAGLTLDLTAIPDNRIMDIEQIDLTGSGANSLVLDQREVLNLSSHSNTLVVRGDSDDSVDPGSGWTVDGTQLLDGDTFLVLVQGAATLLVQQGLIPVDLAISKSESVDPVVAGNSLTYIVTVTNGGSFDASGIDVSESLTLPAGVSVDSITPSVGTYSGAASGTWALGNLAAGSTATLTVILDVDPATAAGTDIISNTATIANSDQRDANPANDSVTVATSVIRQVDLQVTKTESVDPVIAGSGAGNLTYVVTVANAGPSDASGVQLDEAITLPAAGVSVDSVVVSHGSYDDVSGVWTLGDLAAGTSETLTVVLTIDSSAAHGTDVISNAATVTTVNETDTDPTNDTATQSTSVQNLDFGDAPAPYSTTLAENGARHANAGPRLGAARDSEADGTHSAAADADDLTGTPDDEDGVTFGTLRVGLLDAVMTVNVQNAPSGARLDAWIDFDGDGSWSGPQEQIADNEAVVEGDNPILFDVPSSVVPDTTFARIRVSSGGDLDPTGEAADGEVEDYPVTIVSLFAAELVEEIQAGPNWGQVNLLTDVNGTLFFTANDGVHGHELWKSDGTPEGTMMVKDITPGYDSPPAELTNVNGTLFFTGDDGVHGRELWKSDGTPEGTVMVEDIEPGPDSSVSGTSDQTLTNVGGTLFFRAWQSTTGAELWISDGTPEGTVGFDKRPGDVGIGPENLIDVNGTLFFAGNGGTHYELWKSDGTFDGTVQVKEINPNPGEASMPDHMIVMNGTLFFAADDGVHGRELWKSDGTESGTQMVKDIWPGAT